MRSRHPDPLGILDVLRGRQMTATQIAGALTELAHLHDNVYRKVYERHHVAYRLKQLEADGLVVRAPGASYRVAGDGWAEPYVAPEG